MILHIDSDVSFLSLRKTQSCAKSHYYLSSLSCSPAFVPTTDLPPNGLIYTLYRRIRNVMASIVEAEIGNIFLTTEKLFPFDKRLRNYLIPNLLPD